MLHNDLKNLCFLAIYLKYQNCLKATENKEKGEYKGGGYEISLFSDKEIKFE